MKYLKIIIIIILTYLFIRNFHLLFIYKDALFCRDAKKELSGKIVYDSTGEIKGFIVIIELPSGKKRIVPRETISWGTKPSFSPDGKRIVFEGRRDILYMINADGTNLEKFFNFMQTGNYTDWIEAPHAFAPSWSPGGERIAFIVQKNGYEGLYITDVKNPYAFQRILKMDLAKSQPAWSPDGKRIAVVTAEYIRKPIREGWHSEVFVGKIIILNIDGSGVRVLAGGIDPSWSPDGKMIAYHGEGGYWIIDANDTTGSSRRFIFSTKSIMGPSVSVPPRWSPDGKYLTVGKKLWYYTDGIYAIPTDNPKRKMWIDVDGEHIGGMSWVK